MGLWFHGATVGPLAFTCRTAHWRKASAGSKGVRPFPSLTFLKNGEGARPLVAFERGSDYIINRLAIIKNINVYVFWLDNISNYVNKSNLKDYIYICIYEYYHI